MAKRFIEFEGFAEQFKENCKYMKMGGLASLYGVSWPTISKLKRRHGVVGIRDSSMWGDAISKSLKGRKFSAEWIRHMSEGRKGVGLGRKLSDDHKKKLSEARKGMKFTEEHRKNIGIASSKRVGWRWSEDVKRRQSEAAVKKTMLANDRRKNYCTLYKGIRFFDVGEAKVAARLDDVGVEWEYERHAYLLSTGRYYMPDFKVSGFFIEVRRNATSDRWGKLTEFSKTNKVIMVRDADDFGWSEEVQRLIAEGF